MKLLLIFFTWLWLLVPVFTEAQQVRVLSDGIEFRGDLGSTQRKTIILQNETNQVKIFLLKSLRGNIGSSQKVKLCIGDQCYDPKKDLAKIKLTLKPGELLTDLYLEFGMGIAATRGSFDLTFVNENNLRDLFIVEARYEVDDPAIRVDEFDYKDIMLSDVYPNPSVRIAQFDYNIKNQSVKARIAINSFIGNPIADYDLDPDRNALVINVSDYNPGIYFYTLFLNNKNIVTKKLVVKK
ncbi:putative secreted protein (Por secretion system target) [Algoriphagus ratkowskyi]|uniref:Putative secreted protein (Por secretion system target) n=1 Tax=Algoriphagus ratkowskyi TaxID=57028 RepID=A0A2W7QXD4_9BACT|nr:T9SS type A sorting domain-containing protein [Algoriphagus ratkowskyi]PZX50700.1 putative secreted protein (Por secretion system target) [Algoriphagus ratkowskyi]TXD75808.1 T9SS type A sorting domain-containing protein [Algoriphagus ratkowskyi]